MYVVLGASGHVGSAVAKALLGQGKPVTVVLHDPQKAGEWQRQGAQTAVADVHDPETLRRVLRTGRRLFLLNPPAAPSSDTAVEERKSLASILAALAGTGLEKIVAESTYGARPGDDVGDLGVLYEMEQALAARGIPTSIIRAAYYLSNWDNALATAQREGQVHTLFPVDFKLPMVDPRDIGQLAARLLTEPAAHTGLHYVEGPERYSAADVAAAFATALHRPVTAVATPREQWPQALKALGFSEKAAKSFVNMTAITLAEHYPMPTSPTRGRTSLHQYVADLVQRNPPPARQEA